jgi:hypothetical protein
MYALILAKNTLGYILGDFFTNSLEAGSLKILGLS